MIFYALLGQGEEEQVILAKRITPTEIGRRMCTHAYGVLCGWPSSSRALVGGFFVLFLFGVQRGGRMHTHAHRENQIARAKRMQCPMGVLSRRPAERGQQKKKKALDLTAERVARTGV